MALIIFDWLLLAAIIVTSAVGLYRVAPKQPRRAFLRWYTGRQPEKLAARTKELEIELGYRKSDAEEWLDRIMGSERDLPFSRVAVLPSGYSYRELSRRPDRCPMCADLIYNEQQRVQHRRCVYR